MNVFVTGATGVLGRRVVPALLAKGHRVRALARSRENLPVLARLGAEPFEGDLFDRASLTRGLQGQDAVVHAATAIPTKARVQEADFAANDRIRGEGTTALVDAARSTYVRAFVYPSIVWLARPADGAPFAEDAPVSNEPVHAASVAAERTVLALEDAGIDAGVLRFGWFYAPDAATTLAMGTALRKRRMPIVGRGDAFLTLIHADDAASAIAAWLAQPKVGTWHVCDREPVTTSAFLAEFARALGAKPPRHVPVWLAKLVAGAPTARFLTESVRTNAKRFEAEFGWQPRYPDHRAGLAQVCRTWAETGSAGKA